MAKDATQAKIDEIIADAKQTALDDLEHDFSWSLSRCESPIEKLFAAQLIHPTFIREYDTRLELMNPPSGLIKHCELPPFEAVYVYQQIKIGEYRVDFLLKSHNVAPLIVECDGHDWHERTKEQASRDKVRDRYLVGRGFRILRFTGSEIFADAFGAANEAVQILLELAE